MGRDGKQALHVYARGDAWEMEQLDRFVREIEQVDPQVTGHPVQAYYASQQMETSYYRAAGIAACVVGVVLLWDLKHLHAAALAAVPTVLGLIQLFGLMGFLQIPLNPANIIVLPLIIGIGIDDGIHVMHDFLAGRMSTGLGQAATAGILLTSLTSMIGFGSLIMAHHEGLRSLGRVATLGIACCLLTSTITLPCLLGLIARQRVRSKSELTTGFQWGLIPGILWGLLKLHRIARRNTDGQAASQTEEGQSWPTPRQRPRPKGEA